MIRDKIREIGENLHKFKCECVYESGVLLRHDKKDIGKKDIGTKIEFFLGNAYNPRELNINIFIPLQGQIISLKRVRLNWAEKRFMFKKLKKYHRNLLNIQQECLLNFINLC